MKKKIISIMAILLVLGVVAYAQYMELMKYYSEILPTKREESGSNQRDKTIIYYDDDSDEKEGEERNQDESSHDDKDNSANLDDSVNLDNSTNLDDSASQDSLDDNESSTDDYTEIETDTANSLNQKNLSLYALSALLMDAENGRVLYEKNGYDQMAMASTTKIMTCLIALEYGDLDDVVTVSKYAATMPDVQLNIRSGDQFKLGDLLYSLMLESHNDVAVAIAEHIAGSAEGFAALMNEKARVLGCTNTNFVTPNGLDAEEHYTTAYELAIISSYAIKNEEFIKITNTPSWEFKEITSGRTYAVSNKDRFLYMMNGAIGIKTGFTNRAGYCFVGAVDLEGKTFISVVLGSGWPPNKNYKWSDTTTLMNYGCNNYTRKKIIEQALLPDVYVENGQIAYTNLYHTAELELLLKEDEIVTITYYIPKSLHAPIEKDTIVGRAEYYINDKLYTSLPIYVGNSVKQVNFKFYWDQVFKGIWHIF